ncbi:class A beta-lactamase-related serine hydrolase [Lacihabitans sp. LS3-19]|uniref:serine hydrolase domain-containing protein n=1 Tax=Lacihabitans sp. LS3-19 TaxID=2487335 RepID=UPI0020CD31F0|nr:serine hydrolase domain-containing protein [Lacihabitans sp. LS3-19]MCP9770863.1 class A beta-lactamase-related serine hydrolase [Lacihabitans sp. LS3-19]
MKRFQLSFFLIFMSFTCISQSFKNDIETEFLNNPENIGKGLLVIKDGKVLYKNVSGWADRQNGVLVETNSNFRMASVTKQFTAAAIYLLQKKGNLNLNQNLTEFFPDFCSVGKNITVHHLLTHSSGIIDYEEIMPSDLKIQLSDKAVLEMVQNVNRTYFAPGTEFRYSNTAFCLLALIIEKVSGEKYDDFLYNEIFKPLGMSKTVVYETDKDIPNRAYGYALNENKQLFFSDQSLTSATKGDGGVYTSLDDYEKWFRERKTVLGLDFEKMFKLSNAKILKENYYSFGWFVSKGKPEVLFHSGSTCGFTNMVLEVPASQTLVVYFTNLADNSTSFAPIESILKKHKILPAYFSSKVLHERTN